MFLFQKAKNFINSSVFSSDMAIDRLLLGGRKKRFENLRNPEEWLFEAVLLEMELKGRFHMPEGYTEALDIIENYDGNITVPSTPFLTITTVPTQEDGMLRHDIMAFHPQLRKKLFGGGYVPSKDNYAEDFCGGMDFSRGRINYTAVPLVFDSESEALLRPFKREDVLYAPLEGVITAPDSRKYSMPDYIEELQPSLVLPRR